MKRFTATEKWSKSWYQELPCRLKCLWQFLCDSADAAGVWDENFKLASFQIGETVCRDDFSFFGDRLREIRSGKWLIVSFLEFQYGKLSEDCRAHLPIFRAIKKHNLQIPYPEAIQSLKEEEEEQEEETETDLDGGGCKGEPKPEPAGFVEFWSAYPRKTAKDDARRAWKKKKCAAVSSEILVAIRLAKASDDWTKEGGKYIPFPATWLNRGGWEDDPSTWPKESMNGKPHDKNNAQDHTKPHEKYGW